MTQKLELTILMPCLNEAETLGTCIKKAQAWLETYQVSGEVVIADNGSTDGSRQIAESMGARVIPVPMKGYGSALLGGISATRGKYIIMGDADDSYDFSNLMPFLEQLRAGYELVMGNRFLGGIERGAMPPLHRYLGNPALTTIGRLFFHSPCRDFHCGLRGFSRDSIQRLDLRATGMEFASEMVVKATVQQLRITEVPTTLSPDGRSRAPHLRSWRDGWRHLRYMLMMAPNWLFFVPAGFVGGAGAMILAMLMPGPLRVGQIALDVHTMLLGMAMVILGVYLFLLGCFVKVFTFTTHLAHAGPDFATVLRRVKLEHGLLAGLALTAVGLVGDLAFVVVWYHRQFGQLDVQRMMRPAIFFTTLLVVGVEVFFGCFFLSMLGISRGDYVGDYTAERNQK